MSDILRAASGQQSESLSQDGPSSYPSGGFSIRTNLGRVDEAMVQTDDMGFDAKVSQVTDNNVLQVAVVSQDSGNEVSDSTDLSGVSFTYDAYRL